MTCVQIEEQTPLFLSGELTAGERRAFERHLAACPACERTIEEQRAIDRRLSDEYLRAGVETRNLESQVRAALRRKIRWPAVAGVALAAGLAAFAVVRTRQVPPIFQAAALDHRAEVLQKAPRHWRTSDAEVDALFARFGEARSNAALPGYQLIKAKICGIEGRRALHLVYSDGHAEHSVYLLPKDSPDVPARAFREGAERVAAFRTHAVQGLVVTEGSAADCDRLVRSATAAL